MKRVGMLSGDVCVWGLGWNRWFVLLHLTVCICPPLLSLPFYPSSPFSFPVFSMSGMPTLRVPLEEDGYASEAVLKVECSGVSTTAAG